MNKLETTINWLKGQIKNTGDQEEMINLSIHAKNGKIESISTFQCRVDEEQELDPLAILPQEEKPKIYKSDNPTVNCTEIGCPYHTYHATWNCRYSKDVTVCVRTKKEEETE